MVLVDDDENILTVLCMRIEAAGYSVATARNGDEALECVLARRPVAVVSDLRLENENGLDVMARVHEVDPDVPVLILTAHGSIPNAIEAMNRGATAYLTKPVDRDELFAHLTKATAHRALTDEVQVLRAAVEERGELQGLVGRSASIRKVFSLIERVAPMNTTVAVFGESGTGKELAARAIHGLSRRANRSFIPVNCAALPDTLLQSELFGYKKGAFTDARSDKPGLFAAADGGTLLLDEIGDVSPTMQRALLRVIQEGEITPLGSNTPIKVDVRVIVSTNRDLAAAVRAGTFREDLYYRLVVVPLHLPPLSERMDDVPLLVNHFLKKHCNRLGRPLKTVQPEVYASLAARRWPGNVRELEHAVERAVVLSDRDVLDVDEFSDAGGGPSPVRAEHIKPLREARDQWERGYLVKLLKTTGGNVSAAARLAGKYRADLYGLLKKHQLNPSDYK